LKRNKIILAAKIISDVNVSTLCSKKLDHLIRGGNFVKS